MPGVIDVVVDFDTFARVSQQGGETEAPGAGRQGHRVFRPDHRHRRRLLLRGGARRGQAARGRLRAQRRRVRLLRRATSATRSCPTTTRPPSLRRATSTRRCGRPRSPSTRPIPPRARTRPRWSRTPRSRPGHDGSLTLYGAYQMPTSDAQQLAKALGLARLEGPHRGSRISSAAASAPSSASHPRALPPRSPPSSSVVPSRP